MQILGILLATLYYTLVLPPLFLLRTIVLRPVAFALYYISLPIRHVLLVLLDAANFSIDVLKSYESVFIYTSVAAIVGAGAGGSAYLLSRGLFSLFNLQHSLDAEDEYLQKFARDGRTVAAYRQQRSERRAKRAAPSPDLAPPGVHSSPPWIDGDGEDLVSQTILEEEDSEDF